LLPGNLILYNCSFISMQGLSKLILEEIFGLSCYPDLDI